MAAVFRVLGGLLAIIFIMMAMYALSSGVMGHEFYPPECCSNRDCSLAIGVTRDDRAGEWVMPNGERIAYGVTRPTPDGIRGIHWCRLAGIGKIIVRGGRPCVFVPKAGG